MTNRNEQKIDFMILVERMRNAQKAYFASLRGSTEQKRWLMESKSLENLVDAEIVKAKQGQTEMFGGES